MERKKRSTKYEKETLTGLSDGDRDGLIIKALFLAEATGLMIPFRV